MPAPHQYGLSAGALVQDVADDGTTAVYLASPVYTFWNDQLSTDPASRYTNLTADAAGDTALPTVTGSDGTDGYLPGQLLLFWQQDDVTGMWMAANGGARVWITANDIATSIDALSTAVGDVTSLADNLQTASNSSIVVWLANLDGSWNPRPDWAGARIVDWQGPSAPPIGGMPEYARNNDRWTRSPVA